MTAHAMLRRAADGHHHVLDGDVATLGRGADAEIVVPLTAVSRRHAEIQRRAHGYLLRDLQSRNGTFVNGERLGTDPWPLRDGDQLVIAGVEEFVFVDPVATPVAPSIGRLTGVWIDQATGDVWVDAQLVQPPLSDRQQALIELLADNEGDLVARDRIVEVVWADADPGGVSPDAIDALVKRLRDRIRPLQLHGNYLDVRRGRGVRLTSR